MQRTRTAALLFVLILVITTFLDVAKADGHQTESFDISYLYPLGAAFGGSRLNVEIFIPIQLANLRCI